MWIKILGRVIFIVGIIWFMFLVFPLENIAIWLILSLLVMIIGLTVEYHLPRYDPLTRKRKDKPTESE